MRVWRRACDYLGLMKDPAICSSILGPSRPSQGTTQKIGSINWNEGATKMIAHIPFYILGEQEGEGYLSQSPLFMYLRTHSYLRIHVEKIIIYYFLTPLHMYTFFALIFPACGLTCTSLYFGWREKPDLYYLF
jgi:hypothetical protein